MLGACSSQSKAEGANDSYILVKELEFLNQSLTKSDVNDMYVYRAQIKNNSNKTIKGINIDIELSDGNYTTISTYDTLLPGEISSYVECFGPSSGDIKDMKATKILITMIDESNKETVIKYDVEANRYEYEEGNELSSEKPKVLVSELEFVEPTIVISEETSAQTFQAILKNNSLYKVTGVVYTFELPNGMNSYFMSQDVLEPTKSSALISSTAPESGELSDLVLKEVQYTIINDNGTTVNVTYDKKLDIYSIK
ncbi:MAG TPA: hypothetical protein DCY20_09225 [Firmicutes bacterium]|nr:hypothetical protein [Bacillota bacterium]